MSNRIITKDITTIQQGVIMHQVNCQNVMGAGVAKALYTKYPTVKSKFHKYSNNSTTHERFGKVQPVRIHESLIVLNSFSQFSYGNSKRTNQIYTDMQKLIDNLVKLDHYAKKHQLPAFVPYRIGCGLAGGDWDTIQSFILNHTNIIICQQP